MGLEQPQPLSRPLFFGILALAILVCLLDAAVVIFAAIANYSGFFGDTPITATCSSTYWISKFTDTTLPLKYIFTCSILSTLSSLLLVLLLISLLVKLLKEQPTPILGPLRILLYLSSSCLVWTGIVPAAWFLAYYFELDNCTASYNSSEVMGLAGAWIAVVVIGVVLWALIVFGLLRHEGEEEKEEREVRYREVGNVQTEGNQAKVNGQQGQKQLAVQQQQQQEVKHEPTPGYRQSLPPEHRPEVRINNEAEVVFHHTPSKVQQFHQQTNQNLYDSPSRKPIAHAYSKQPQSELYGPISSLPQQSRGKGTHVAMPVLQAKDSRSRFGNQSRERNKYFKDEGHNNQDELVFHKQRHSPEKNSYMNSLLKESKQYLHQHGARSILDADSGIQERDSRARERYNPNPDRDRDNSRRNPRSPEKEGVLLNYIRGKYAG